MLKARRNATTPVGNCEDNWLVRVAIGAHILSFPLLAANESLLGDPHLI